MQKESNLAHHKGTGKEGLSTTIRGQVGSPFAKEILIEKPSVMQGENNLALHARTGQGCLSTALPGRGTVGTMRSPTLGTWHPTEEASTS